jgi:hypothetical protein
MKRKKRRAAALPSILFLALCLPMACSPEEGSASEEGSEPTKGSEPAAEAPAPPSSESQIPTGRFVGNVVETMDAGTYTYVALEGGGERVWAVGPKTPVAIGDEISIALEMPMPNFESETLGRTFETVYFVGSLGAGTAPGGHGVTGDPHAGLPQFQAGAEVPEIDPDSIQKPESGYRVAELWDRREELNGKEVVVRGRVVRYNAGILGRNWLHIQDGSGDAGQGTHDVTVTSAGSCAVGDLVTIRGVVAVDKDFGAGYRYDLIVEEAEVDVQD